MTIQIYEERLGSIQCDRLPTHPTLIPSKCEMATKFRDITMPLLLLFYGRGIMDISKTRPRVSAMFSIFSEAEYISLLLTLSHTNI